MGYSYAALAKLVVKSVSNNPDIKLIAVARQTGVDRHTLSRALQTTLGLTFREVKLRHRRQTAMRLLRVAAHLSIKQIAFDAGYQSPSAFGRDMRLHVGLSPSMWRSRVTSSGTNHEETPA